MDTFAFIIHPNGPKQDVSRKFPLAGRIFNVRQIYFLSSFFPPVYVSEIGGIISQSTCKSITSNARAFIHPADLPPGSLVCDVVRLRDVLALAAAQRDDVLFIDGGTVEVPGSGDFYFDYGYPPGRAHASEGERD